MIHLASVLSSKLLIRAMCPGVSNLLTLQSYIVIYKCAKFMHSYADIFLSTRHELEPPWKRDLSGRIASIELVNFLMNV